MGSWLSVSRFTQFLAKNPILEKGLVYVASKSQIDLSSLWGRPQLNSWDGSLPEWE
jgi:hypothetical protein